MHPLPPPGTLFLFRPPYRDLEPLLRPRELPAALGLEGAAIVWCMKPIRPEADLQAVRRRVPGMGLIVVLPPADSVSRRDEIFRMIELCRPTAVLPHHEEPHPDDLRTLLGATPDDLPGAVVEYLRWRGLPLDTELRQLVRRTLELSGEIRSVTALARGIYLSRRALGRRFTSNGLPPPSHWLHVGRVLRATLRIHEGDAPLTRIGFELGYPDAFALSNQISAEGTECGNVAELCGIVFGSVPVFLRKMPVPATFQRTDNAHPLPAREPVRPRGRRSRARVGRARRRGRPGHRLGDRTGVAPVRRPSNTCTAHAIETSAEGAGRMRWPVVEAQRLGCGAVGFVVSNICPSFGRGHFCRLPEGGLIRPNDSADFAKRWTVRAPAGWWDGTPVTWTGTAGHLADYQLGMVRACAETPEDVRAVLERFRVASIGELFNFSAVGVRFPLPGLDVEPGDVIHRVEHSAAMLPGNVRPILRAEQEPLRDAWRSGALRDLIPWSGVSREVGWMLEDRRTWGRKARTWTPRLALVRPFRHTVSEPIHAETDAAAVFELLASVGCRMPPGGPKSVEDGPGGF